MHPLNKLRLQAGLIVDPALESTQITEARKVPLTRTDLTTRDQKSLTNKVAGLNSAIKHIQQAIKSLDKIPATDFMGDIPHFINELDYVLDGENGGTGLTHLLGKFDKDQKTHLKDERKAAKAHAEEEEAAEFNQQCQDIDNDELNESWWDVKVKHRDTDGFNIQADTREEAEEKAKNRLSNMRGGNQALIISIKQNTKSASSNDARLAKQLDNMDPKVKDTLFKKADIKSRSGGSLSPLETYILQSSKYKVSKTEPDVKDQDQNNDSTKDDKVDESMHYYVDNQYTNYEDDEDKPVNVTDGSSNDEQVWDNRSNSRDESPCQLNPINDLNDSTPANDTGDDSSEKMTIPSGIKQQLKSEITQARAEAKTLDASNKDAANFYNDLANAFEELSDKLESGTIYDFKQAQIYAQTLMGAMLHKIPNDVWKFLTNGGQTRSLKSYMQEVK